MEEAPENGKESPHSAHANGMNEWMDLCMIYTMFVFLGVKWLGHGTAQQHPRPKSGVQVKEEATKAQKICGKLNKLK